MKDPTWQTVTSPSNIPWALGPFPPLLIKAHHF